MTRKVCNWAVADSPWCNSVHGGGMGERLKPGVGGILSLGGVLLFQGSVLGKESVIDRYRCGIGPNGGAG